MLIKSYLKKNGVNIDSAYLERDDTPGARYACRKWIKDITLDVVNDNIQATITIDGAELTTLELEAQQKADRLVMTRHAEIGKFYTWVTMSQGRGKTFGVSYGVNDVSKDPGLKKKEKTVPEDTQLKLF